MAGSGNNATACPHKSKRHYAKGMCGACYRRQRLVSVRSSDEWKPREKLQVTTCEHTDAKHYARGLCAPCYRLLRRNKQQLAHTAAKETAEAGTPPVEAQPATSPSSGAERGRRGLKKRTKCPHKTAGHYAKGYCKQCYHIVHRNPNLSKAEDGASTSSAKRKSHDSDTESDATPDNKD